MLIFAYVLIFCIFAQENKEVIEGLNMISLYENWDIKGTGVAYYHQILLL